MVEMKDSRIAMAHAIAARLEEDGCRGPDGLTVLAMAMGIYLAGQPDAHRDIRQMSDLVFQEALHVFDVLRAAMAHEPGHG